MPDYPVGIRNGLITGEHRRRMGMALWEFCWLVDHVTEEYERPDGETRGRVLGGTVISAKRIAGEMDVSENTVQDSLKKLYLAGYIDYRRDAYGYRLEIRHSKKWARPPTGATDHGTARTGEQENRRTGESSDSTELRSSCSPAPLDNAVSNDSTESNASILLEKAQAPDAKRLWAGAVAALERQMTRQAWDAVRSCQPVAVDGNVLTVVLPEGDETQQRLARLAVLIRQAVTQVAGRLMQTNFVEPGREARAGPEGVVGDGAGAGGDP